MMRTVVVATALSIVASIATSAIFMRIETGASDEYTEALNLRVVELMGDVDRLRAELKQSTWEATSAANAAVDGAGAANSAARDLEVKFLRIRSELDEMQTQIRLLKLTR